MNPSLPARNLAAPGPTPGSQEAQAAALALAAPPTDSLPHRTGTLAAYQVAVERVILHMKSRLAEPLDLDTLATVAAISKFHLVRVFDELTGTTPRHFLACLRVQRAKELLLAPNASITDICLEVGYTSLGTFSKTFSSLVGLSPQEFRALPRRLTFKQFASAIWHYLASSRKLLGPVLEGTVEASAPLPALAAASRVSQRPALRGFIFVGSFTEGVPQGAPFSGTVMVKPGTFRIERPALAEFHLLAVLVPFGANLSAMVATIPVGQVASLRVRAAAHGLLERPRLQLRPVRLTDPPILLALPALPPWRRTFTR